MNKTITIIIFMLMTLTLFTYTPTIKGATPFLISNFDDVATGLDSGTSVFFDFENVGTPNYFETSSTGDLSPPNSIKCNSNGANVCDGYLNLTTDFSYINLINFSFIMPYQDGSGDTHIRFYNDTDTELIDIRFYYNTGFYLYWQNDAGFQEIYHYSAGTRYYLVMQHNGTNQFNIKLLDGSYTVKANKDFSTVVGTDWTNFSYIRAKSTTGWTDLYLDNFYLDITPPENETFVPDINLGSRCANTYNDYTQVFEVTSDYYIDWACVVLHLLGNLAHCIEGDYTINPVKYVEHETEGYYNERIRHVLLPVSYSQLAFVSMELTDYQLMIDNQFCGYADYIVPYDNEYGIVWENVNVTVDGKIDFAVYCSEHTTGFQKDWYWYGLGGKWGGWGSTKGHNSQNYFYDGILDGTPPANFKLGICWYYDNSSFYNQTDPWKLPIIDDYDEYFGGGTGGDSGNGYIEFLGWNSPCYYKMGARTTPSIVFNLSGLGAGNGTKTLWFGVYRVKTGDDEIVYNGFIEIPNADYYRDIWELSTFDFARSGQYYIMCYNTSNYGLETTGFIHRSETITVCQADSGGGSGGGVLPVLDQPLGSVVGLIITIFCLLIPFILGGALHIKGIPNIVYAMTGGLGLAVSTVMGLFPSWLPFFIIAIGVIILVFTYLYNNRSTSEG